MMEQILDTAELLFSKHGFHGVTLKDVEAGRRPSHFAQLLFRRQEDALRRGVRAARGGDDRQKARSEEHTSELQSLMRISYAVFCLKQKDGSRSRCRHRL